MMRYPSFDIDVKHYPGAYFGQGNGPIFYQFVDCNGDEANFTECSATYEVDCTHSQDVGVVCLTERTLV